MTATNRGTIGAAGDHDPAEWIMGTVVPMLRDHFKAHGTAPDAKGNVYTLRVAVTDLLVKDMGLKGSGPRVLSILVRAGILKKLDNGNKGKNAYPPLWGVSMIAQPTRKAIRDIMLGLADEATEARRKRRRRDDRLAGEYPTQTTGGPVETIRPEPADPRHYHTDMQTHAHEGTPVSHRHTPAGIVTEGETDGKAIRRREHTAAGAADMHKDVRTHQHGTKTGAHRHEGYKVVWVEHRHHTHYRPVGSAGSIGSNGVHHEVVTDPASGHQVVQVGPERDQRHRALLDILADRDAQVARLTSRNEWLEGEVRRLADQLLQRDDPSVADADAYIAAEQARKAKP